MGIDKSRTLASDWAKSILIEQWQRMEALIAAQLKCNYQQITNDPRLAFVSGAGQSALAQFCHSEYGWPFGWLASKLRH